jgi:hypothetical protein
MFCGTAQVAYQVCQFFFVSSVSSCACDCGGNKQGCRLLFASHIGHNVIRKEERCKMWSKKWYLKGNTLCDAYLLNELLETDVP